jgi:hypothetical protein
VVPRIQSKKVQDTEVIKQGLACLPSAFWDKDGILLVDYEYLEKGAAITAKYYVALLDKLKQQLVSKCRGKLLKDLVSSRQCCSSQGSHYAPEVGRSSL